MTWLNNDPDRFDETSVRVRPPKKGSRARTKVRPSHDGSVLGMILSVDRGRYLALVDEGEATEHTVIAKRARELAKIPIVTGDLVNLVGDVSGETGTLARIVSIQERTTVLRRSADDSDTVERVMVANADQMLIVVAAANPEPRQRLVDRYLVAAFDAGIAPIICITKTDLAEPTEFLSHFTGLDVQVIRSRSDEPHVAELLTALVGHRTVAVGHSGVGKSTLVNAVIPEANRATGAVNEVTGRGRHTSSSTESFRVPGGGWLIDTPGVRSFGLGHVKPESIIAAFADLSEVSENCPRGCNHFDEDCAMVEAVSAGTLGENAAARLDSVQRLLRSL